MPKVSVIIPVYGVEEYIERCARSLFGQTLDDIEYLFIDDCTPDGSIENLKRVLEKYPQRKPQVTIHRMEKNSGQAKVREWGIRNAKGKYLIHCDSDDWVDMDMYRALYERAKENDADVVVCDFVTTDGKDGHIEKGMRRKSDFISDMMYSKVTWALWNKLIKRTLFEGDFVYPSNNVGEDMAIVLQAMLKSKRICYVEGACYNYYFNPTSVMNRQDRDSLLNKYNQMCNNIAIVEEAFTQSRKSDFYRKQLDAIKFYCQSLLIPVLDKELIEEWITRFRISYWNNLWNPKVNLRYKLRYVMYRLGLYNFIMKLR